jgi:hypothetical protein
MDTKAKEEMIYQGYEGVDELKTEMNKIKVLCIASLIMEQTRMLSKDDKQKMENFCDKIMLRKYTEDQEQNKLLLKKLVDYKNKHIDLLNVRKVGNLQFRDSDETWLKSLFKRTQPNGFKDFYHDMLQRAIS